MWADRAFDPRRMSHFISFLQVTFQADTISTRHTRSRVSVVHFNFLHQFCKIDTGAGILHFLCIYTLHDNEMLT